MTTSQPAPSLRPARPDDAEAIAQLHAASWRLHYRGAYSDAYLDGDVLTDRRAVWTARLAEASRSRAETVTYVVEDGAGVIGFVHAVVDHDPRWGSLIDNLHVTNDRRGSGLGTLLLARAAEAVVQRAAEPSLYLWVQEQNTAARGFYRARGAEHVETVAIDPPGGVPERLNGHPNKLRMVWTDATSATARRS
ncbi:GNAT family N-acetyltransferase [Streptomyces sp. VRA16 Mangrove soil]|uniref:GNAT family N-acetyltransferase n=1 Tax=Streptomyces sp. VRA16 Mangrove soil TaxID=2817434 RepID=UPI001A9DF8E1|nr:GNAT family N-acetyltransferase [Streptomyces sp. VRA16 Mangrove soil]MBO1337481.1 GNAT family N-acetyltransferase [Streptomyces sp. VRA16 Mangrove soil]